ncbi:hypothetical protein BaRGS_00032281 [Batillaria attramentaria]|uniref:Uncharacterized protein n=1 Tax=Batillaria attramentaria TaxID=370345 RepID=A0ABD0JP05_9CAEN
MSGDSRGRRKGATAIGNCRTTAFQRPEKCVHALPVRTTCLRLNSTAPLQADSGGPRGQTKDVTHRRQEESTGVRIVLEFQRRVAAWGRVPGGSAQWEGPRGGLSDLTDSGTPADPRRCQWKERA